MATSEPRLGRRPLRPVEWAAIAGAGVVTLALAATLMLAATGVLDIVQTPTRTHPSRPWPLIR